MPCPGLLALALVLPACGAREGPAAPSAGTIPVVASTDVYGAVVQAVGGDRVTVTSLIDDPAADPHSYEAPPAAAAAVARARLVVVNGGGYDDFAERLTPGPDAKVIDVVALSGLTAPAGGELNEHVWYSLPTMKKLAGQIATDLGAADPAGAARSPRTPTRSARGWTSSIARVDALKAAHARRAHRRDRAGAAVPDRRRRPGRRHAAGVQRGRRGGRRPARRGRRQRPSTCSRPTRCGRCWSTRRPGRAVTDQVEQAARAAGVPVVEVGETLPAGTVDYVEWINGQLDALGAALDRP